jgi:hypothetical protein
MNTINNQTTSNFNLLSSDGEHQQSQPVLTSTQMSNQQQQQQFTE